jgi:hypothetical protein
LAECRAVQHFPAVALRGHANTDTGPRLDAALTAVVSILVIFIVFVIAAIVG